MDSDAIIRLENLEKKYPGTGHDVYALRNINLTINKGEIFGIIGKSGAGKSTLVRCMNLLERPTAGAVYFKGQDLLTLSARQLNAARRSMGMIFQQFNLLMQRTALENARFPLELAGESKEQATRKAAELLELVGLAGRANAYPSQLSGGQKQRVAIARALSTSPQVLLCDEATSALDPATTDSILGLIRKINEKMGITAVIITHEMAVVDKICEKVAIISKGEIIEQGSVQEVFFHPRTEAARNLVLPEALRQLSPKNLFRLIFNGRSSQEPVISNMVLHCGCPINIMYADTRDLNGTAVGQMVVELPSDEPVRKKVLDWASQHHLILEKLGDV